MWLDHDYFPFEVTRHIRNFFLAFRDDYDLRFQETRDRRLRIISTDHVDGESLQELAGEWDKAAKRVSFLDWIQLIEWSEDYRRLHLQQLIRSSLHRLIHEDLTSSQRATLNRLREIEQELNALPKAEKASWLEIFYIRWRVPALTEETEYLVDRLKSMQNA